MSIKSILKTAETVGVKAVQVGDLLGAPGLDQLNTAIQIIEKSNAEPHDKAAAAALISAAKDTPIVVSDTGPTEQPVAGMDSKRFKALVGSIVLVLVTHYVPGLPPQTADLVSELVGGLAAIYIFHETWRPSGGTK